MIDCLNCIQSDGNSTYTSIQYIKKANVTNRRSQGGAGSCKLQSCPKDIREHKRRYRIYGIETEIELIRARSHFRSTSKFGKSVYLSWPSSSSWFKIAAHEFKMRDTRRRWLPTRRVLRNQN